jgi:hypothetical protein
MVKVNGCKQEASLGTYSIQGTQTLFQHLLNRIFGTGIFTLSDNRFKHL